MEEHCEAYFAWKRVGIRGAWCWHVDAHLDIGRDGLYPQRLEALAACQSLQEAESKGLCGNAYVPWGGLHCGNYLYPAILEGIVSRLTWVIPPDLPEGSLLPWARSHLDGWFDLSLEEYASFALKDGYVEGRILGIPFTLGRADRLPLPDEPVLLDIDLDYFLDSQGELWQEPEALPLPPSHLTTVAYSVKGGFTPQPLRRLAIPFVGEDIQGYRATLLDQAAALVRLQSHAQAIPILEACLAESFEASACYLLGTCYHHAEETARGLECWNQLLTRGSLPPEGRAYVHGLCAEAALTLDSAHQALDHCQQAERACPFADPRLWVVMAQAQQQLGHSREATRLLRRALKLAENYLGGLQIRIQLAQLYREQGKEGLAQIELKKLGQLDVTGLLKPLSLFR